MYAAVLNEHSSLSVEGSIYSSKKLHTQSWNNNQGTGHPRLCSIVAAWSKFYASTYHKYLLF